MRRRGFTALEILITVMIFVILAVIVFLQFTGIEEDEPILLYPEWAAVADANKALATSTWVPDSNEVQFVVEKIEPLEWRTVTGNTYGEIYFIVFPAWDKESETIMAFRCNIPRKDWKKALKLSLLNFSEEGIRRDFERGKDIQLDAGSYEVFVMKRDVFLRIGDHE